ncbi:MAG: HNH endonuclease [Alphaproteobacteria bacterium]|nr:HNH endonuclease [Alphaproteobacteria bacterium]
MHRLVSIAFLGEPDPEKNTVHHRNSNRKDNDL